MKRAILLMSLLIFAITISVAQPPNPPPRGECPTLSVTEDYVWVQSYEEMDYTPVWGGSYTNATLSYSVTSTSGVVAYATSDSGPLLTTKIENDYFVSYDQNYGGYVQYNFTITKTGCTTLYGVLYVGVDLIW